jgi:hypothetical protein
MKNTLSLLFLCFMLVSGCASRGPVGSFCGPLPERSAVTAIAADAVACLAGLYPPGHTTLRLLPAKEAENSFASDFESGLRARGFRVAADASPDAVIVAYTLDALYEKDKNTAWYLQLRLSDGITIARAYTAAGQPEAGRSRTVLEDLRSALEKFADAAKDKAGRAYDSANALMEQGEI